MPESIGPHLLGRIPSPPDERDFRAEHFVGLGQEQTGIDPVALAKTAMSELALTNSVSYSRWASTKYKDVTSTHWWKALAALSQIAYPAPNPTPTPSPTPNPSPAPSGTDVVWSDKGQLDQGQFGTCTGNGWAQWGNTDPINDTFTEGIGQPATKGGPYARAIYYEATVIDGKPDDPDAPGGGQQGATVRSAAKAMQARNRLSSYAKASDIATIKQWLQTKGSVVVGTNWTKDMFTPDSKGYIAPTGAVEGGHCYLLLGDLESEGAFYFQNSWGNGWGLNGYFKMKYADFESLLNNGGEAWVAVELPI